MQLSPFDRWVRPSLAAFRQNQQAFFVIQAMAAGVVVLYYGSPTAQELTERLVAIRAASGWVFASASTVLASVLLPELARRAVDASFRRTRPNLQNILFTAGLFATTGFLVDWLYQGQTRWFGTATDPATVVKKMLVDQGLFSVFVAVPIIATAFFWKDRGFDVRQTLGGIRRGEWLDPYLRMVLFNWMFWAPVLLAIYALPAALQFWLFLFLQGAYALLVSDVGQSNSARP